MVADVFGQNASIEVVDILQKVAQYLRQVVVLELIALLVALCLEFAPALFPEFDVEEVTLYMIGIQLNTILRIVVVDAELLVA